MATESTAVAARELPPLQLPNEWPSLSELLATLQVERIVVTLGLIVLGLFAARLAVSFTRRATQARMSPLQVTLISRTVFLLVLVITASFALQVWGMSVTVLFGAAGILTLAIGFASQTSASNLIAGMFLMVERSFSVGDVIQVGTLSGEVVSIDLLSVKLRKFDNVLVRIPNDKLIKSDVETFTKFPIRRIDLRLQFHPDQDLEEAKRLLLSTMSSEPRVLVEPSPDFALDSIVDGAPSARLSAWATQSNFVAVRSAIVSNAMRALREGGIALAGPRRRIEIDPSSLAGLSSLPVSQRLDDPQAERD